MTNLYNYNKKIVNRKSAFKTFHMFTFSHSLSLSQFTRHLFFKGNKDGDKIIKIK